MLFTQTANADTNTNSID